MVTLGSVSAGRDNNLNLLRMIAATAVLVSHAVPITLGPEVGDPPGELELLEALERLEALVGMSLGGIAVLVFFILSGFLIAASATRGDGRTFLVSRALRLLPGLVVSVLVVAFGLGLLVTELPAGVYLTHPEVYEFVLRNSLLLHPSYTLPGVFEDLPWPTVEGSIWTLRYEAFCYAGVFLAALAGLVRPSAGAVLALAVIVAFWLMQEMGLLPLPRLIRSLPELGLAFGIGVAAYVWRARIVLSLPVALGLMAAAYLVGGNLAGEALFLVTLAYVTFWLAYVPGGWIRGYNRVGDYSYGTYIYAFPVQGLVVWLFGPQTPMENVIYALPPTLVCAVLSWHLVEQPALRWKTIFASRGRAPAAPVA
ncbi:acyltransferase family protein [Falsirhodobacter sp. 20TX0035]|uniref:acyltransferase family protein n=1 Tax=Falsirhodobacter sp. 20TX0035 TaxID=3022019 RepID=UPI0023309A65|nr:acyltransferase [Falsirhodobacter sp. 20TX0035]MDB6452836.1 acyltransferase [Falsirhodobacter sp. 20TX0035]